MIVKSKKTSRLIPEGPHLATLVSVAGKPNDADPKKILFHYKVDGREDEVIKEVPASFEERKPLRRDAETLLARQMTAKEAEDGLDLQTLPGKRCQIVVEHKSGVGGKTVASVALIQPVPKTASSAGQ